MNEFEEKIIDRNLSDLIRYTKCSALFLSKLEERKILADCDTEKLQRPVATSHDNAYNLYKILQTRVGAYAKLKLCLKETNQSGALRVLEAAEVKEIYGRYKALTIKYHDTPASRSPNWITIHQGTFGARKAVVKVFMDDSDETMSKAKNEINILNSVDWHDNIVRYFIAKHVFIGEDHDSIVRFAIALDYEINLEEYLEQNKDTIGQETPLVLRQIWNGVTFLHTKKILHLDIKLENIFINRSSEPFKKIQIGEFGYSFQLNDNEMEKTLPLQTVYDKNPAVSEDPFFLEHLRGIHNKKQMTNKTVTLGLSSDVFCLGIVFYQVLSRGIHPFGDMKDRQIKIRTNDPSLDKTYLNTVAEENLLKLISKNPIDRPDITKTNYLTFIHNNLKASNCIQTESEIMGCQDCKKRFTKMETDYGFDNSERKVIAVRKRKSARLDTKVENSKVNFELVNEEK